MKEYGNLTGIELLKAMQENGDERIADTVAMLQARGLWKVENMNFDEKNTYNAIVNATTRGNLRSELRQS